MLFCCCLTIVPVCLIGKASKKHIHHIIHLILVQRIVLQTGLTLNHLLYTSACRLIPMHVRPSKHAHTASAVTATGMDGKHLDGESLRQRTGRAGVWIKTTVRFLLQPFDVKCQQEVVSSSLCTAHPQDESLSLSQGWDLDCPTSCIRQRGVHCTPGKAQGQERNLK